MEFFRFWRLIKKKLDLSNFADSSNIVVFKTNHEMKNEISLIIKFDVVSQLCSPTCGHQCQIFEKTENYQNYQIRCGKYYTSFPISATEIFERKWCACLTTVCILVESQSCYLLSFNIKLYEQTPPPLLRRISPTYIANFAQRRYVLECYAYITVA